VRWWDSGRERAGGGKVLQWRRASWAFPAPPGFSPGNGCQHLGVADRLRGQRNGRRNLAPPCGALGPFTCQPRVARSKTLECVARTRAFVQFGFAPTEPVEQRDLEGHTSTQRPHSLQA